MQASTLEHAAHQRTNYQQLLRLARHLPEVEAAIITMHLDRDVGIQELAIIHGMKYRQMRLKIDRLKKSLADPCFLLAAKYAAKLPASLELLAREYWLEGKTLRDLATARRQSLHRVRSHIITARSLLLISLAADHPHSREQVCNTLAPDFSE